MKPPAFQFYPDDFLAGVSDMSNEEVGAYIRLLCHQWSKGGLPNDIDRLVRLAGPIKQKSMEYVLAKFKLGEDGQLRNHRLEVERQKQKDYRDKQSNNGKTGANKRWQDHGDGIGGANGQNDSDGNSVAIETPMATGMANEWPNDSSPSPSPSPSPVSGLQSPLLLVESLPPTPKNPKREPKLADDEQWLQSIEADPTYRGIPIRLELGKMTRWRRERGKQPTRKAFINWLNRADRPLTETKPANQPQRKKGF